MVIKSGVIKQANIKATFQVMSTSLRKMMIRAKGFRVDVRVRKRNKIVVWDKVQYFSVVIAIPVL